MRTAIAQGDSINQILPILAVALDHIPIGIVIVRDDGRIRFANNIARNIAKDGGLVLDNNLLSASRREERGHMLSCIKKATHSAAEGTILPGEAITLERPDEKPPLQVIISTLWSNHQRFGMGVLDEPYGILFVTDPNRPQETSSEQLRRLFGLTRSEARLTERLVAGDSVKEAAAELGVTEGTVRTTLKAIFYKTGVTRQPELVKVVMTSPLWVAGGLLPWNAPI